jgi:hypothetical protein
MGRNKDGSHTASIHGTLGDRNYYVQDMRIDIYDRGEVV